MRKFTFNGLPRLETAGERLLTVRSNRMWALVGYLAVKRGQWISRLEVAEVLWPDSSPAQAKQNLRQLLLLCAKGFGNVISANRTALRLDDSTCECDIWHDGIKSNFFEASAEDWVVEARPASFESVFNTQERITDSGLIFLEKLHGTEFDQTATSQLQIWVSRGRYDGPIQVLQSRHREGQLSLRGHGLLANLYHLKGLQHEARATLNDCVNLEGFQEDVYYLFAFCQLNHFQYRLDLALEYADRASKRATLSEPFVFFGSVATICMLTDPQKHLPIAQKYYQIAVKNQFKEYACRMNYFTALSEVRQGDRNVLSRLEDILAILKQGGREGTTAKLLARVGQLYNLLGLRDQAENTYLCAVEQARVTEGIQNVTEITTYLAEFYTEQGEHSKALAHHTECISIRRDLGHQWGLATSLRGAGFVSMKLHDHLQAKAYLKEALRLYETIGDMMGCASVLLPFAKLYFDRGHFQKSLQCAMAVQRIFGDSDDESVSKSIPAIFATRAMLDELLNELNRQSVSP